MKLIVLQVLGCIASAGWLALALCFPFALIWGIAQLLQP